MTGWPKVTAAKAAAALCAALLASGCGAATSSGGSSGGGSGSPSPSTSSPGASITVKQLAAKIQAGTRALTSARIGMTSELGGHVELRMTGAEQVKNGAATAMELNDRLGSTATSVRVIGDRLYIKLPAAAAASGKSWLEVSTTSSNPMLRRLASQLASAREQAATNQYGPLVASASAVRTVGPETVGGVPTTHYRLQIDPAKEHNPLLSATEFRVMKRLGLRSVPVDMWLDAQGRPVKVVDRLRVYGHDVVTTITLGGFDQPVHIVAPPAGETATGISGLLSGGIVPSA
jgi:hypothetical protein